MVGSIELVSFIKWDVYLEMFHRVFTSYGAMESICDVVKLVSFCCCIFNLAVSIKTECV